MKVNKIICYFLALTSVLTFSCVQDVDEVLPSISYVFQVEDSLSFEPISGALIDIVDESQNEYNFQTDIRGKFTTPELKGRIHLISISSEGFVSSDTTHRIYFIDSLTQPESMRIRLVPLSDSDKLDSLTQVNDSLESVIDSLINGS